MTRIRTADRRPLHRTGAANPVLLLGVVSVVLVSLLVVSCLMLRGEVALSGDPSGAGGAGDQPLRVYCAAGLRKPTETIAEQYAKAYGVKTELHASGSGTLFGQLRAEAQQGGGPDVYITAEDKWAQRGRELGLIREVIPIGTQRPVLIVQPGNPKGIRSMRDFVAPGREIDFGIANAGAAIGVKTRLIADAMGIREPIESLRKTEQETVIALASAVALKSLDAAVVWDTAAHLTPGVEVVPLSPAEVKAFDLGVSRISVCITSACDRPAAALTLARYLTARDQGLRVYQDAGISVPAGDKWAKHPDVVVYCGSMFESVIADRIASFNKREGVTIRPQWAGCGKLVAQMQVIDDPSLFPAAYFACDRQFMDVVQDDFEPSVVVSANDIVIATQRDNPKNIRSPKDLLQDGLKVGVCHPEDSALGRLTKQMLSHPRFGGIYPALEKTKTLEVDTGPTLVSQILTGSLDAVVVYRSNILSHPPNLDKLDIVPINDGGTGLAQAVQPWAVSRQSEHKQLMTRLFEHLRSDGSADRFREAGFDWRADKAIR